MARKALPPRLDQLDGVWYVKWTEGGRSQRTSLRTADLQLAQSRFQGWLEARQKHEEAQKAPNFALAYKLYLEQHGTRRTESPESLEHIGKRLCWYFGDMRLEDISAKDIQDYTAKRRKGINAPNMKLRAVKDGTIRKELGIMRACFKFMVKRVEPKELRVDEKALAYIEIPSRPAPRNRVLSDLELARIRELCAAPAAPARLDRLSRYIWLLMETGARSAALRELTWKQVDLERGFIQLNPWGRNQTNKRRPVVPISDSLKPVLLRAWTERTTEYVLDHTGQIRKSMERFMDRHCFPDVTAHTFRHTFATHLAQAGVSMIEIAQLLGDSLATVEKNYLHLSPTHLRKALSSLSAARKSDLPTELEPA